MELLAHTRIVSWEGASLWVIDATKVVGDEPRRVKLCLPNFAKTQLKGRQRTENSE
jgi:hypothetical protein